MKQVARACLFVVPFVWACSYYDLDGMALASADQILVGDTFSLSFTARDGSMPSRSSVMWSSSDPTIATVDELGVVTGTAPGWVLLKARALDYALQVPLLVLAPAGPFVSVDAGGDHVCGLAEDDGRAWCWGKNEDHQLGSDSPDRCYYTPAEELGPYFWCAKGAVPVVTELRFTQLVVGDGHNCGLSREGTAYCWGLNDTGQLGDGGTETRQNPAPVLGEHVFESLAAAGGTTCGITRDDALLCWGSGLFRVDGAPVDALTEPAAVADGYELTLVVPSAHHVCGLTTGGSTYCWGRNEYGQLGVADVDSVCGPYPCAREPQEVASAPPFVDLALGDDFSCGLTAGGVAHCWGSNEHGQLGDGGRAHRWEPMPVGGGHSFTALEAGADHACGLDAAGAPFCWGGDPSGFGNGGGPVEIEQPIQAASGLLFTSTSIGFGNQCGLGPSGIAWCWGRNSVGAVGNGRTQRIGRVTVPDRVVRHPALEPWQ